MKRFSFCFLFFVFILNYNSFSQNKIKLVTTLEEGYSYKIIFSPKIDSYKSDSLTVSISPISGDDLNGVFNSYTAINGKHNYSYFKSSRYSFFLQKNKKNKNSKFKSDSEFLIDGLSWLLENDSINQSIYDEFIDIAFSNTNDESFSSNRNEVILNNPYYFNNTYLSIFKVTYENKSNHQITIPNDFAIVSDQLLYKSLSNEAITHFLSLAGKYNIEMAKSLMYFNHDNILQIPPDSKIIKYIAYIPIKYSPILNIYSNSLKHNFSWGVVNEMNTYNENLTFYELNLSINLGNIINASSKDFIILKSTDGNIFIDDKQIFVLSSSINKTFDIYVLSLYDNSIYYSFNTILPSDYIDLSSKKRKSIVIKNTLLKEVVKRK